MKLVAALAPLVADLEGALVRIGRGDVADQLRAVEIASWSFDDFADAADVHVVPTEPLDPGRPSYSQENDIVSLYDELGVNLHLDAERRIERIEILQPGEIVQKLQALGLPMRPAEPG